MVPLIYGFLRSEMASLPPAHPNFVRTVKNTKWNSILSCPTKHTHTFYHLGEDLDEFLDELVVVVGEFLHGGPARGGGASRDVIPTP